MSSTATAISQITVNGELRSMHALSFVSDLICELNLDTRKIAIEQNGAIVPRSLYATTPIHADDVIEIVGFIGGG